MKCLGVLSVFAVLMIGCTRIETAERQDAIADGSNLAETSQIGTDVAESPLPGEQVTTEQATTDAASPVHTPAPTPPSSFQFEPAVRLMAGQEMISVESPGYACPTMADVDGDGRDDLVVGQFSSGAMQLFRNVAEQGAAPRFENAVWIKSNAGRAEVPGVW